MGKLDLRLFDGSAAGAPPAAGTAAAGAAANSAAAGEAARVSSGAARQNVVYGRQADAQTDPAAGQGADPAPDAAQPVKSAAGRFDELLKDAQLRAEYDKRVQDQLGRRFKRSEDLQGRLDKIAPVMELLGEKYGVKPGDVDALREAILDDDSYYEDEAIREGLTVEQLKRIRAIERENAQLKAAAQERQQRARAEQVYAGWMSQAEQVKSLYPTFDFAAETQNPKFGQLLKSGVDVRTAYEVLHRDEIIGGAMQFAAQTVAKKVASGIASRADRPDEAGMSAQIPAAIHKQKVAELDRDDVLEIARRAMRGEKIRF